jgi:hypothetical protein
MTTFAFLGRCSTEDQQDPESSRGWQLNRATALVEPRGGVIVTEYFDRDCCIKRSLVILTVNLTAGAAPAGRRERRSARPRGGNAGLRGRRP